MFCVDGAQCLIFLGCDELCRVKLPSWPKEHLQQVVGWWSPGTGPLPIENGKLLFCCLQIKNIFMPYLNMGSLLTQISQFEQICKSDPHISILYKQLSVKPDNTPPSYVNKWAHDLGCTLEIADWSSIWTVLNLLHLMSQQQKLTIRSQRAGTQFRLGLQNMSPHIQ